MVVASFSVIYKFNSTGSWGSKGWVSIAICCCYKNCSWLLHIPHLHSFFWCIIMSWGWSLLLSQPANNRRRIRKKPTVKQQQKNNRIDIEEIYYNKIYLFLSTLPVSRQPFLTSLKIWDYYPHQAGSHQMFRGYKSVNYYHRASVWGSNFSFLLWKEEKQKIYVFFSFFFGWCLIWVSYIRITQLVKQLCLVL